MLPAAGNPSVFPNSSLLRKQKEVTLHGIWTCKRASPGNDGGPSLVTLAVQSTVYLPIKLKLAF